MSSPVSAKPSVNSFNSTYTTASEEMHSEQVGGGADLYKKQGYLTIAELSSKERMAGKPTMRFTPSINIHICDCTLRTY